MRTLAIAASLMAAACTVEVPSSSLEEGQPEESQRFFRAENPVGGRY